MQTIAASELILNSRGAVYHLDLLPEELAPWVITVGDPDRVKEVSKHFDRTEVERQHREFITHTGWLGSKRVSVVSTGIGTDNIDIVLNELDALVNIDLETRRTKETLQSLHIIRVGTSGSLQTDIPVDAFVASTHGIGIDNLLHFYRHEPNEEAQAILQAFITHTQLNNPLPYVTSASVGLLKNFVQDFHQGITVTCPGFYAPQGRVLRLGLAFPELVEHLHSFQLGRHRITNFEMETAALYGLGHLLGHQCLSLSAIVANRRTLQFSKDSNLLIKKLIINTLQTLDSL